MPGTVPKLPLHHLPQVDKAAEIPADLRLTHSDSVLWFLQTEEGSGPEGPAGCLFGGCSTWWQRGEIKQLNDQLLSRIIIIIIN